MQNVLDCSCVSRWNGIAPLILRVSVGLIFAMHGWQKLQGGLGQTAGFLDSLNFPAPEVFAFVLIAAELVGGIMLILGLFTHWVAKILAIVAVVAFATVHATKGFFISGGGYEFILLILAVSVALIFLGPGKFSLDGALKKKA
ncbi:MAG: DoxX family protein [Candidatus Pacebacteria bacterium]|nr:DoxX family protein [Candidatus Paceibacterota bacterium]